MIRVVDGDNYFRRRLEKDVGGMVLRNLLHEVQSSPHAELWVWDGYGGLKRRRDVYPAYKSKRPKASEDIYKTRELFQQALLHTKATQIRVPEYEGDDVVAAIARRLATRDNVLIESNDKDLLQLATLDTVKVNRDPVPDVHFSEIRLWKTLVGDSSDDITGIPGFGQKAWKICEKEAFIDLLEWNHSSLLSNVDEVAGLFLISKRCASWLIENEPTLRAMWEVIGFYDVPWHLVRENSIAGTPDMTRADNLLRGYFQ